MTSDFSAMNTIVTVCHSIVTPFCDNHKRVKLLLRKGLKNRIGYCHGCHIHKDKDSIKYHLSSYLDSHFNKIGNIIYKNGYI